MLGPTTSKKNRSVRLHKIDNTSTDDQHRTYITITENKLMAQQKMSQFSHAHVFAESVQDEKSGDEHEQKLVGHQSTMVWQQPPL